MNQSSLPRILLARVTSDREGVRFMSIVHPAAGLGAIFDWDGVIIDSHDQHEESWQMLFDETGRTMPEGFFKETFGMRNQQIIPAYFEDVDESDTQKIADLGLRKEELYRELIRREGIEPLEGVLPLLDSLKVAGIPCSVGSSTPRKNVDTIIEMIGLKNHFSAITTAEDVTRGKPEPDVFLKAAEKVEREPSKCVVFEDAHVGIKAGLAAGMKVIAVATTHPAKSLGDAHLVVERLTEISVEKMTALVGP
ncbi:MAG: HAD family phosphatase [Verrucomicrobiota bacterium]